MIAAAAPVETVLSGAALKTALRARLRDWRTVLRRQARHERELLQRLIVGRLECEPQTEGFYVFRGTATWAGLLEGVVPTNLGVHNGNRRFVDDANLGTVAVACAVPLAVSGVHRERKGKPGRPG